MDISQLPFKELYKLVSSDVQLKILLKSSFQKLMKNEDKKLIGEIHFKSKEEGAQFGLRVFVPIEGEELLFHVKSHQNGVSSERPSSLDSIDIREIFVYKFLEYFGMGAQIDFFVDENNFNYLFISSKDLGKNFKTFQSIIKENIDYSENMLKCVIKADLIQKMLELRDLLSNPDNFGFMNNELKVIDFKIEIDAHLHIDKRDLVDRFLIPHSSSINCRREVEGFFKNLFSTNSSTLRNAIMKEFVKMEIESFEKALGMAFEFATKYHKQGSDSIESSLKFNHIDFLNTYYELIVNHINEIKIFVSNDNDHKMK